MGTPKALLQLEGRTFLQRILDTIRAAGLGPRFLVLNTDERETSKILSVHDLADVTILTNPEPDTGPIGSIRSTLRAIPRDRIRGLLVWPVDLPHVSLDTIRRVVDDFEESSRCQIVVPCFNGRRGRPSLFGALVFEELMDVSEGHGANVVVRRDASRVLEVGVEDPAVICPINTPLDYQRLLKGEGPSL